MRTLRNDVAVVVARQRQAEFGNAGAMRKAVAPRADHRPTVLAVAVDLVVRPIRKACIAQYGLVAVVSVRASSLDIAWRRPQLARDSGLTVDLRNTFVTSEQAVACHVGLTVPTRFAVTTWPFSRLDP